VPKFKPLPGLLIFPNLPLLAFWLFGAGCVKNAVRVLAWQAVEDSSEDDAFSGEEHASGVQWGSGVAPSGSGEALEVTTAISRPTCGRQCTLLAVAILLNSAMVILTALWMAIHFWRRFGSTCWKPTAAAEASRHVADPVFRVWSRLKAGMGRLLHTPPRRPSADEVRTAFLKFDRSGDGKMDREEVLQALVELRVLPLEMGIEAADEVSEWRRTARAPRTTTALAAEPSEWHHSRPSMKGLKRSSTRAMLARGKTMNDLLTQSISRRRALRAARSVILRYDTSGDRKISEAEFAVILKHVQSKLTLLPPQQRIAGKWAKPPGDLIEPARTERILAAPFRILHTHAADCLDAQSMTIIAKTNGRAVVGILFQCVMMCMQIFLAILSGLGKYLAQGGTSASAQVLSIAAIKLVWAIVLVVCSPCACGLTNAVIAGQCLSEGVASILLWAASAGLISDEGMVHLNLITFMLLLVPVFVPIFQKVYDGLVTLSKLPKRKANLQTVLLPIIQFSLMLSSKFGVGARNFNPKSLARTVKQLLADTSQQGVAIGKGEKVKVKRMVRRLRRPNSRVERDGVTTLWREERVRRGLGADQEQATRRPTRRDSQKSRRDADGDDDGDDGGDDGD